MDKSWMTKQRLTEEYRNGLHRFLDMAFNSVCVSGKIMCPCKYCRNGKLVKRETAEEHLIVDGFMKGYTHWIAHGEDYSYSQKSSEMNKETRAKLVDHHHMGQRGYAVLKEIMKGDLGRYPTRAELYEKSRLKPDGSLASYAVRESIEKMKEIATQNPRSSNRSGIIYDHDDEFAKVFGGDKDGRVRLYGLGVKATDIYGGKVSRATLLRQNMEYREELAKLQADFEKFKRGACGTSNMVEQSDSESDQVASPPISRPQKIRVGSFVMLKSLINSSEVVAIGIVNEMGGVRVNGMVLGPAFCNIVVQSIMKKDEHLAFPYGQIQTIEDSLGAPVA